MQHIQINDLLLLHLSIGRITFLKFEEKRILAKKLDSSHSLALLSIEEISKLIGREVSNRADWDGKENLHMAEVSAHYCDVLNIKIILFDDENYPELLRQISDPPYLLFCRGNEKLLNGNCVSVVGTRRLSPFGKQASKQFSYEAALNGCNVVSGLAHGADSFAHKGVIDAFFDCTEKGINTEVLGKTIAVVPGSIDEIVPYGNRRLAGQILQCGGCIISEYEPKLSMASWHFVGRNRIIAGFSPATVVIEAPAGSGALITADFAVEYNRELMFHETAFCKIAQQISISVKKQLEMEFADGRISKYKIENTPEKFLELGAPVIKNFSDYCEKLEEGPLIYSNQIRQEELF